MSKLWSSSKSFDTESSLLFGCFRPVFLTPYFTSILCLIIFILTSNRVISRCKVEEHLNSAEISYICKESTILLHRNYMTVKVHALELMRYAHLEIDMALYIPIFYLSYTYASIITQQSVNSSKER
jgi:hypothetical protein